MISTGTYNFTYSFGEGNCVTTDLMQLTVTPLPVVNAGPDLVYCVDAGTQVLSATPTGGIWTGSGITNSSGVYNPDIATVGLHEIVYEYTDGNGCENRDTLMITVNGYL